MLVQHTDRGVETPSEKEALAAVEAATGAECERRSSTP